MVVTTQALTRRYGELMAVDGLDLDLPSGGVIGLVGPNGSGKSTLIRMLLGLVAPSGGTATVLDCGIDRPQAYARHVGALIENPAFVPALSARANLASLAVLRLLILDEPTNGLDPAGIVEIRALLQGLGSSGRTVIVSSHLLSEIETICSYVVVIRFGVLVFSGPIAELMSRAHTRVDVAPERASDLGALSAALMSAGWHVTRGDEVLHVTATADEAAVINRQATAAGVTLRALGVHRDSLEAIFLAMTGSDDGELATARGAALPARTKRKVAR